MRNILGVIVFAIASTAAAQPGSGPCRFRAQMMRPFDPKTVVTLAGEVFRVGPVQETSRMRGTHLWARTAEGKIEVILGPDWFIGQQEVQLAVGDQVEVRGSRVDMAGKPAIVAVDVRRGLDVLKLRGEDGVPLWAGCGKTA